jgi:hypothetical protein
MPKPGTIALLQKLMSRAPARIALTEGHWSI